MKIKETQKEMVVGNLPEPPEDVIEVDENEGAIEEMKIKETQKEMVVENLPDLQKTKLRLMMKMKVP